MTKFEITRPFIYASGAQAELRRHRWRFSTMDYVGRYHIVLDWYSDEIRQSVRHRTWKPSIFYDRQTIFYAQQNRAALAMRASEVMIPGDVLAEAIKTIADQIVVVRCVDHKGGFEIMSTGQ